MTDNLNSLLSQKVLPDEVIIYDDASCAPAKNYIPATDFPIKVIRNNIHKGVVFARNELLKQARSEYAHFQDSDDLFASGWTSKIINVIVNKHPDIILTEVMSQDKDDIIGLKDISQSKGLVLFAISHAILPVASTLFHLGDFKEAKRGFNLAKKMKKPLYRNMAWHYRLIANIFGPMAAEKVSLVYRRLLPDRIRRRIR